MKTYLQLIVFVALVAVILSPAAAQKKATTVHGELVELTSYLKDGIKPTSVAGKEIALGNLGKGGSLALLEKGTSKLYIIGINPADSSYLPRITGFMGGKVYVKGPVVTRNATRLIMVEDIGKSLK
jgi:hypothetical protein